MDFKQKFDRKLKIIKEFTLFLIERAKKDAILRVASALAYTSLIALVPLFAIGLAIFSAFPVFDSVRLQVEEFLFNNLAPSFEQDVSGYFSSIVKNTKQLTTIGVIGLVFTAVTMLSTIENSFNFIFKVSQPRRIGTKITLYWTVITLGPLLLGTAFSMRGYLFTLQQYVGADGETANVFFGYMIPPLMTILCLMLVYILVPNKKVGILSALAGATVTVMLFWVLRQGFGVFVLNSATYTTLYGALATIPIFLLWMYLSWAAVILGAVFTAAIDDFCLALSHKAKPKAPTTAKKAGKKKAAA